MWSKSRKGSTWSSPGRGKARCTETPPPSSTSSARDVWAIDRLMARPLDRRFVQPERGECCSPSGALVDGHVLALGGPGVDLTGPVDLRLRVFHHLLPVGDPARKPSDGEEHGKHLRGEPHRPVDEARVEVDVRVQLALEEIALEDEYFVERKLYPNVDFYSGLIYRAMGFPTQMFPVLFAIGRLPGWIAHWKEMMEDPKTKIDRPRQIYTGPAERKYVPIDQRS